MSESILKESPAGEAPRAITGKPLPEGLLALTREELERMLRSLPDCVWSAELSADRTFEYRYLSPVIESISGYPSNFFLAGELRWQSLVHPDDLPGMLAGIERAFAQRAERLDAEYRIRRQDGSERWVRDSVLLHYRADGTTDIDGVLIDLTDRKLAEQDLQQAHADLDLRVLHRTEALASSEERFRQLAENIGEVFWITTPDKQEMLYISPAYQTIFGRSPEQLYQSPLSFLEAIHPEDVERLREAIPLQAEGKFDIEYRVIRPDGSQRWVRSRAFPVKNEQGDVYRIAGLAQDITERREAAEKLRESEELYRLLLESHVDGVTVISENRFLYVNPRICQLTGRSEAELLGLDAPEILLPEDRQRATNCLAKLLAGEPEALGEYSGLRADGAPCRWEIRSRIVRFRGEPAVISFIRDVTQLRAQEEQRRLWELIIGHSQDAIVTARMDGTMATWNPGAERLFGYTATEALGQSIALILPPERADELPVNLERIRTGGSLRNAITQRLHRDGRRITVSLTVSPIVDAEGNPVGASAIFRDMTEQIEMEKARQKSEAKWESLVSTAPDLILIMDADGTIRYINRTSPGTPPETVYGHSTYEYVHPDFHDSVRDCLRRVWEQGEFVTCVLKGRGADGGWRWYESRHGALRQDGETIGITVISSDITDRKNAEQQLIAEDLILREMLEQRERERQLIAHEVHDGFMQDIVGAQYCLQAMLHNARARNTRDLNTLEGIDISLRKAVTEGRRLIRELGPLVLDDAGLVEAVRVHMVDEVEDGRLKAELVAELDDTLFAPLFKGTIFRIVQESLTNVRRHSKAKQVVVSMAQQEEQLLIEIRDNGIGFDPHQVPPSRYGLVGIRQRARLFGGQAEILSSPGAGTVVRVKLPIVRQRPPVEESE